MKRRPTVRRKAFSLLEVIAAVVILAVVAAATVATIAPMRQKADDKLLEQSVANVAAMAQTYYVEKGTYPRTVVQLAQGGYLDYVTAAGRTKARQLDTKMTIQPDGTVVKK